MESEVEPTKPEEKVLTPGHLSDLTNAHRVMDAAIFAYGQAKYGAMIAEQRLAQAEQEIRDKDKSLTMLINKLQNIYGVEDLRVDPQTGIIQQ